MIVFEHEPARSHDHVAVNRDQVECIGIEAVLVGLDGHALLDAEDAVAKLERGIDLRLLADAADLDHLV